MHDKNDLTVPFDPGFAKFYPPMDENLLDQLNSILSLKGINQRKFQLQVLENNLIKPISTITAIYCACVMYGSIIATKYKDPAATITDNHILLIPEEDRKNLDLSLETKYIIEVYQKLNKSVEFLFKRKSKLPTNLEDYANLYIEFILLNNHFKELKSTDQLKLPEKKHYLQGYSLEKLSQMEQTMLEIAKKGNLEEVFNIS